MYIFFQKNIFRGRHARWLLPKWQNLFTSATEVATVWVTCVDLACLISESHTGTQIRSLFVDQIKMAMDTSCCTKHSHVTNQLPSWQNPIPLTQKYKSCAYCDRTARQNASKKSATEGIRLISVFQGFFLNLAENWHCLMWVALHEQGFKR